MIVFNIRSIAYFANAVVQSARCGVAWVSEDNRERGQFSSSPFSQVLSHTVVAIPLWLN